MNAQKTLQWHVQETNERRVVQLSGELTRDTLFPLWEQRASFLSKTANLPTDWDLNAITRLDSAGFTLLAELLHFYSKQATNRLLNAPENLRTLAELYDLENWFNTYLSH